MVFSAELLLDSLSQKSYDISLDTQQHTRTLLDRLTKITVFSIYRNLVIYLDIVYVNNHQLIVGNSGRNADS